MATTAGQKSNVIQLAFDAGRSGRRLKAIPTTALAINSQIRSYGKNAVARSRYLATNNPYAAQAKEEFVAAFAGNGIKPSSLVSDPELKDEIQNLFLDWTDESDADGLTDFYGQQAIIGGEMFEAGEIFIRIRERYLSDGLSVPMQLQLIPAEMCPTDFNQILGNGRRIECGIQFNAIGKREGYWFYRNHPGEILNAVLINNSEKVFVPADQVLHLYKPIRAGQIRGIPHTLAGIITLAMLDLYDDAELERKRVAALFAAFIRRKPGEEADAGPFAGAPTTPVTPTSNQVNAVMEPGATIELEDGQDVTFSTPADVGGNFEAFEYRTLLRAMAGFGVPYSQGTGDLKQTSYGSQRGGMITFRRRVEMMQNAVMIFQFCRPIWRKWMDTAILAGALPSLDVTAYVQNPRPFRRTKWITPKWDWIDPLKDVMAEKLLVDCGFKARDDVIEGMGEEPADVDARIRASQERASEMGLVFIQLPNGVVISPDGETLIAPAQNPNNNGNQSRAAPNGKARGRNKVRRYIWDC